MLAQGGWRVELRDAFSPRAQQTGLADLMSLLSTSIFPRIYTRVWKSGSMGALFQFSTWFPWISLRVLNIIKAEHPDVVICTHALPCGVLSKQNRTYPLLGVATDFQVHAYWPVRGVDGYVVASRAAVERMQQRGVPAQKLRVLGIPVQPDFACLAGHNSTRSSSTRRVLVIAGGGRSAPYLLLWPKIRRLVQLLARRPVDGVEWCFVFGRGDRLRREAERLLDGRSDVTLLGLTQDMPSLMDWADLVVTKPGGLTLAEALSLGKPVLLLQRGAGQEAANADIVVEAGAGRLATSAEAVLQFAQQLGQDAGWLDALAEGVEKLSTPHAAQEIAIWAQELVEQRCMQSN